MNKIIYFILFCLLFNYINLKCYFDINRNTNPVYILSFNKTFNPNNNDKNGFHPINFYLDFSLYDTQFFSTEIYKDKIKNELILTAEKLSEIIYIKNNKLIEINSNLSICHPSLTHFNTSIRKGIKADLVIYPFFSQLEKSKYVTGGICISDKETSRPVVGYLIINEFYNLISPNVIKKIFHVELFHQFIHILGFNWGFLTYFPNLEYRYYEKKEHVERMGYNFNVVTELVNNAADKYYENVNGVSLAGDNMKNKFESHWTVYLNYYDIMRPNEFRDDIISEFTLSFLEDSGWYKINLASCGCSNNGECFFNKNPYEFTINKYGLMCYENNLYSNQCKYLKYKNFPIEFIKEKKYENNITTMLNPHKTKWVKPYKKVYFYEFENIFEQNFTVLEKQPECKCYPRTLFFKYFVNITKENKEIKKYKKLNVTIKDKNYFVGYFVSERKKEVIAVKQVFDYNNIPEVENNYGINLIYKRYYNTIPVQRILSTLPKYGKFNHFPREYLVNEKDLMYLYYKKLKTKFPNDFDFVPESFKLPEDREEVDKKFKDYKKTPDNLWLIKPPGSSLAQGIRFIENYTDIPNDNFISRYIHNPHLLYNKKYHLRIYVLVTGYLPYKIYIYDEGQVFLAAETYSYDPEELNNKFKFITNFAVSKDSKNYSYDVSLEEEKGNTWTFKALANHINKEGGNWTKIWSDIEDMAIKIMLTISDEEIKVLKDFDNLGGSNLYQLYGFDVLIDETYKPWLLEINTAPHLDTYNKITLINKTKLIADIMNLIGIVIFNHENEKPFNEADCEYKDRIERAISESICEWSRPQGNFIRLFPKKQNIDYYSKFMENPDEINKLWWKYIKEN
jgi:hypothetical protein